MKTPVTIFEEGDAVRLHGDFGGVEGVVLSGNGGFYNVKLTEDATRAKESFDEGATVVAWDPIMEKLPEPAFTPATPREALLAILAAEPGRYVASIARAGLVAGGFLAADLLAERLAAAHKLLREIRDDAADEGIARLSGEIDEALMLPPDLEAMTERRL